MTVKYTSDHEWIQLEDHEAAVVGITLHAQDALGDVVFVDLPEVGRTYKKGEVSGVVESVKAAADVFMPIADSMRRSSSASMPMWRATNSAAFSSSRRVGAGCCMGLPGSIDREWEWRTRRTRSLRAMTADGAECAKD